MPEGRRFWTLAVAAAAVLFFMATVSQAQTTVLSNEALQSTTLMVQKGSSVASCVTANCQARAAMFRPFTVNCPAATGSTCTFHIVLTSQIETSSPNPTLSFQFAVDGAAPSPGPTDRSGGFELLANRASTKGFPPFQAFTASVDATVANSSVSDHSVVVYIACSGASGCNATAHWTEMKVEVYEP